MNKMFLSAILLFSILTSSCTTKGQTGAGVGAIGGALAGQAIGHSTEATLIGAAVGTMLGYMVGNEMDKYDREQLNHAYERGTSGRTTAWRNPDTGNSYEVMPQPAYSHPQTHQACRQAEIIAVIDGKTERTYSTACRDDAGRWQLQNR
jgi:surface antigen